MKENIENLDVMIQYLDTVPGAVYFFIIFMSILMVIVVLEMNRIDRFFRKKSVNIYNEYLNDIDNSPGFNVWSSKWKSRLAFLFFVCTFGSTYLAFRPLRPRSYEAGMAFVKFAFSFIIMVSMILLLTLVFYLQQNYAPRFHSKFSAFLYFLFLIVILIALVYFTYFSDFGQAIIYYK